MANFLIVGLGGMGQGVARRVMTRLSDAGKGHMADAFAMDFKIEDELTGSVELFREFGVDNPDRHIAEEMKPGGSLLAWWPRKRNDPYVPPEPINQGRAANQVRANGRLALSVHAESIYSALNAFLRRNQWLDTSGKLLEDATATKTIFVITSLGGGTGAGTLVDVIFMLRRLAGPQTRIFGLFFDGTVTKIRATGTGPMAYAALVELEHRMVAAEDFSMTYADGFDLSTDKISGSNLRKFLNAAILVQGQNSKDLRLSGRQTGNQLDDYKDLAANWLYSLILCSGDGTAKLIENHFYPFATFPVVNGRSICYGGIGCSFLRFPTQDVTRYLRADLSVRLLKDLEAMKWSGPAFGDFLSGLGLSRDPRSFREQASIKSAKYQALTKRRNSLASALDKASKADKARNILKQYGLDADLAGWDADYKEAASQLQAAAQDMSKTLGDATLEEVKRALEERLEILPSLAFLEDLLRFCQETNTDLDKITSADRNAKEERKGDLLQKRSAMLSARGLFGDFRAQKKLFKRALDDYFNSLAMSALFTGVGAQLQTAARYLNEVTRAVRFLSEGMQRVRASNEDKRKRFTVHDTIFDSVRVSQKEYALELKVGATDPIIERIESDMASQLERVWAAQIKNALKMGAFLQGGREKFAGMSERLRSAVQMYADEKRRLSYADESNRFAAELQGLLDESIGLMVASHLREKFPLGEILNFYLEDLYKKVQPENMDKIRAKVLLENEFGPDGASDLLAETDPNEWKTKAVAALVRGLQRWGGVFFSKDTALDVGRANRNLRNDLVRVRNLQRVMVPEGFPFIEAVQRTCDAAELVHYPDQHTIAVFCFDGGYPLYAMPVYIEDQRDYLEHVKAYPSGTYSLPLHADHRYYGQWRDDIRQRERLDDSQHGSSLLAYILGLGCGTLGYQKGKGFFLQDKEKKQKKVAGSLPEMLTNLDSNPQKRNPLLKALLYEAGIDTILNAARRGDSKAQAGILEILMKGLETHDRVEPPKKQEAHAVWENVRLRLGVTKTGGAIRPVEGADLAPSIGDNEAFGRILQRLTALITIS
jgi:hypothetical protein